MMVLRRFRRRPSSRPWWHRTPRQRSSPLISRNKKNKGAVTGAFIASGEGMEHMQRLFAYLTDTGCMPHIGAVEAPVVEFDSLAALFKKTWFITRKINELVHVAMSTQDYPTFNFLQWYVAEQHEEEKLFKSIIDKLALAGDTGKGLYLIDQEIASMGNGV
ncbi:TPA: ferritin [Salmonella enterica]|nr:ferritin [Salmonella enterica]HDC2562830.1 ferritin [Salmonella enterica]